MLRRLSFLVATLGCCSIMMYGCGDDAPADDGGGGGGETDAGGDMGTEDTGGGGGDDMGTQDTGGGGDDTGGGEDMAPDIGGPGETVIPLAGCTASPSDCTSDQECRGGVCVDEITSADDYIAEAAENDASYLWQLQLPSELADEEGSDVDDDDSECCFDYTGDDGPDNQLGFILGIIGGFLPSDPDAEPGLQPSIDGAIEDGTIAILINWTDLPEGDGATTFDILVGDAEQNESGEPAQDFQTRVDGDGNYTAKAPSVDDHGALVHFGLAEIEGSSLTTETSTFVLSLDPVAFGLEEFLSVPIELSLQAALIDAEISVEDNGVHTVDREETGDYGFLGGGLLGGVVVVEEFLDILATLTQDCECLAEGEDLINWYYDFAGGSVGLACNAASEYTSCGSDEPGVCGFVNTLCGVTTIIAGVPDVDLFACTEDVPDGETEQFRCGSEGAEDDDGVIHACECAYGTDGVPDSISIGFRFAATGANITGYTAE